MAANLLTLWPLNDFTVKAKLKTIVNGVAVPLTSGTVTAFLATSSGPAATAADAALTMSPAHLGNGEWLITFDAAVLTTALLDPLFAATPPFLIVQKPGDVRAYAPVVYATARPAMIG